MAPIVPAHLKLVSHRGKPVLKEPLDVSGKFRRTQSLLWLGLHAPKKEKTGERIDRNGKLWRHHGKEQWLEKAVFVQSLLWQNTWASSLQRIKGLCWPSLSELSPQCSAPLFLSFGAAEGYGGNHVVELHLIVKGERGGKGEEEGVSHRIRVSTSELPLQLGLSS